MKFLLNYRNALRFYDACVVLVTNKAYTLASTCNEFAYMCTCVYARRLTITKLLCWYFQLPSAACLHPSI